MLATLTEDDWTVLIYDSWRQTQKIICLRLRTAVEPPNLLFSMETALNLVFDFEALFMYAWHNSSLEWSNAADPHKCH